MKITRLRDELLLGALAISVVVALASMLAVAVVIRHQYMEQAHAVLSKAARVIDDQLSDRKNSLLSASRQLANQKNLGSTLWYLAQYSQSGLERATLANTYQQLARDTYKLGRVAKLSKIAIYDVNGNLVVFSQSTGKRESVGYVERAPELAFMVATVKDNEELNTLALHPSKAAEGFESRIGGPLPQQEITRFAINDDKLAIESQVPIMGVTFDPTSGKQEIKQLGLVATIQFLDDAFVDYLSRLNDVKLNVFTLRGLSSGNLGAYQAPDWGADQTAATSLPQNIVFNETVVDGTDFYQCLIPIYAEKQLIGSIAALQSKQPVRKNIWEMVGILGLIAAACLLIILPLARFFATTVARPLSDLSRLFRSVASGEQSASLSAELSQLEQTKQRHVELNDLTQSFVAMNRAVTQQFQQIQEINASLENSIAQRTTELRVANEELTNLASHDALTGLPNRKLLSDRVQIALASARRNSTQLAMLFIDLDEFKPINDTLGHEFGDQLLKKAARRIEACMRESDTVARFGGDEFIVLLPNIESPVDALAAAEKIRLTISHPFELAGQSRKISTSIGIAIFPEHGSDESALYKNADAAMYQAKKDGRNIVHLYSSPA
ncbi:MAG TPA: GGDEF domain-containing protein [Rhodocyclaceae bacterium]